MLNYDEREEALKDDPTKPSLSSHENGSVEINQEIISLDDFCTLANRLVEQQLFDEAISLYQTASKIFPNSIAIRLNLGRVQELQRKHSEGRDRSYQENFAKEREREDLTAQRYLSLATLYFSRRQYLSAIELLELSRYKNPNNSKTRFLMGLIFYEQGDGKRAMEEFLKAKELDPFYEDIYKHLGNLYYEEREYEHALESFIDAYILSGGQDMAKATYYQRQIRLLLSELNIEDKDHYHRLFNRKKEYFQQLANSLGNSKNAAFETGGEGLEHIFLRLREMEKAHQNSLSVAVELKKIPFMQGFSDEEVFQIARMCAERRFKKNDVIFREEDLTEGIFLIHSGSVRIVKNTPFGEQQLALLGPGEFFGEMDFIDSLKCSADAIASEDSILFSMSKVKLEELFISRRHVAVQFYWHFWKTLSLRIREANELLKSFFIEASKTDKQRGETGVAGESTSVDFQKKMMVLKEKGLSSKELRLLAAFSNEEMFKAGQTVFMEGERGDRLFIILEGQVRISKFIPGVGEEALAILERGDFFGEMALIDRAPRSADARAHTDVTVLPIESKLLTDILSKDVDSSFQFLSILCKILSRRLREINLKVYQWRMMSGGF